MKTTSNPTLERLRSRVRRLQLSAGVGFLSMVVGALLVSWAVPVFQYVGAHSRSAFWPGVLWVVLSNLWLLLVLPVAAYGLAKVADLQPWSTALLAVGTGEAFSLALEALMTGDDAPSRGLAWGLAHFGGLIAGVVLTAAAIRRARRSSAAVQQTATAAAEARKREYDAFLLESERLAARRPDSSPEPAPPPKAPQD